MSHDQSVSNLSANYRTANNWLGFVQDIIKNTFSNNRACFGQFLMRERLELDKLLVLELLMFQ